MRLAVLLISATALAGQHAVQEAEPASKLHAHHTHGRALRMRRGRGGKGRGGGGRGATSPLPGPNATLPQERCKTGGRGVWDLPSHCRRKLPCDIRAFDPGARFNRKIVQSQKKAWAKHNVDPANRHFQNGVEWWVQRGLPPAVTEPEQLRGARRVFVAAYFSYFWIFGSHLATPAARAAKLKLGAAWQAQPERFVTAHGHPGSCVQESKGTLTLTLALTLNPHPSPRPSPHPNHQPKPQPRPSHKPAPEPPAACVQETKATLRLVVDADHSCKEPHPTRTLTRTHTRTRALTGTGPNPNPKPNSDRN